MSTVAPGTRPETRSGAELDEDTDPHGVGKGVEDALDGDVGDGRVEERFHNWVQAIDSIPRRFGLPHRDLTVLGRLERNSCRQPVRILPGVDALSISSILLKY